MEQFKGMISDEVRRKSKKWDPKEILRKSRFQAGTVVGFTALTKDLAKDGRYVIGKRYTIQRTAYSNQIVCYIDNNPISSALLTVATPIKKRRKLCLTDPNTQNKEASQKEALK